LKQVQTRRRGFKEITYSIVKGASQGARKTRVMYASSLNLGQLNTYLEELMSQGLIQFEPQTRLYFATAKGRQYLKAYEKYAETMDQMYQSESMLEEICEKKKLSQSGHLEALLRNPLSSP